MKHTPGPWTTCHDGKCRCKQVWSETSDHPVAVIESGNWGDEYATLDKITGKAYTDMIVYGSIDEDVAIANARLIAAAPDMLGALELILTALDWEHERSGTTYRGYEAVKEAINKAKGV